MLDNENYKFIIVLMKKINTKTICVLGALTALEIVLSRFLSINAWNIKIGFSFVPVVVTAMLFGPLPAAAVAAMGDFLGALLFPIGAYFPGFTVTAFLTGIVFGLFLRKEQTWKTIIPCVLVNQLALSLLLNTFWISVLYGSPYGPLLVTRLFQTAILTALQIAVIRLLAGIMPRLKTALE